MSNKLVWTLIDPEFHKLPHISRNDIIYYHFEYYTSKDFVDHPNNSIVLNFKKDIKHRNSNHWHYKKEAINYFASLLVNTPFGNDRLLLAAPTSKRRDSEDFDSRNDEVLKIVNEVSEIPVSFNLETVKDIIPAHFQDGFRKPENYSHLYSFTPFEKIPEIVYIVDDVITSGSHFVVWRNLIKQFHPTVEVRGFFLARAVNI